MENYINKVINAETGEEILEPMTAEEIAENKAEVARQLKALKEREAEEAAKKAAKAEILSLLGITEEQAKLLLQ